MSGVGQKGTGTIYKVRTFRLLKEHAAARSRPAALSVYCFVLQVAMAAVAPDDLNDLNVADEDAQKRKDAILGAAIGEKIRAQDRQDLSDKEWRSVVLE